MTNTAIILMESVKLMEKGILASTGTMQTIDGQQVEMPEAIHTYAGWKKLGYQVKRHEKAIAQFPIWKYTSKTVKNEETGEDEENSNMFMKMSSFFKSSQVEKVAK